MEEKTTIKPGSLTTVIADSAWRMRQNGHRGRYHDRYAHDRSDQRYDHGETISQLLCGHRVVNHQGREYYQAGERYYIRTNGGYSVVSRPY